MQKAKTKASRFYRIGEAARITGVSAETLRVWERRGLIPASHTPSGYRFFSSQDIERIAKVQELRQRGINARGILAMISPSTTAKKPPSGLPESDLTLGRTLRQLRVSGGLSLAAVATKANISISFLSLVERGVAKASRKSLKAICAALGIPFSELLDSRNEDDAREIVRKKERSLLPSMNRDIKIAQLAGDTDRRVDPRLFTMAPGTSSGGQYAHTGVEFIFVLKGTLRVVLEDGSPHDIEAGDSLFFSSSRPHEWSVQGASHVEALWIDIALAGEPKPARTPTA